MLSDKRRISYFMVAQPDPQGVIVAQAAVFVDGLPDPIVGMAQGHSVMTTERTIANAAIDEMLKALGEELKR